MEILRTLIELGIGALIVSIYALTEVVKRKRPGHYTESDRNDHKEILSTLMDIESTGIKLLELHEQRRKEVFSLQGVIERNTETMDRVARATDAQTHYIKLFFEKKHGEPPLPPLPKNVEGSGR